MEASIPYPEIALAAMKMTPNFMTFNRTLKTVLLRGHLEGERPAGQLIRLLNEQVSRQEELKVIIRLDRMNMPTTKLLFVAFKAIKDHLNAGNKISICWICNHEYQEIIEQGLDLAELYDLPVNVVPV